VSNRVPLSPPISRVKGLDTSIASEIRRVECQDGRDAMELRVRTGTAPGSLPARNAGRPWRFPSFPRPSSLPARCNRSGCIPYPGARRRAATRQQSFWMSGVTARFTESAFFVRTMVRRNMAPDVVFALADPQVTLPSGWKLRRALARKELLQCASRPS
jgi:hypothetical protein